MIAEMPGHVWERWQQFMAVCSFGPLHEDLRAGVAISDFRNVNRAKGQRAVGPEDVFPALKVLERRKTLEEKKREQYRRGMAWAAILGAQARNARKRQG